MTAPVSKEKLARLKHILEYEKSCGERACVHALCERLGMADVTIINNAKLFGLRDALRTGGDDMDEWVAFKSNLDRARTTTGHKLYAAAEGNQNIRI